MVDETGAPGVPEYGAADRAGTGERPRVSLGKDAPPTDASPVDTPPADASPWTVPSTAYGPGQTVASAGPLTPAAPHDQQTLASFPGGPDTAQPHQEARPWPDPNPFAPSAETAADRITPPTEGAGPFAPPAPDPFAPPAPAANPFAPPQGDAVPPPPIAPEGPGQVPYGYPGGAPGPQAQGYPGGYPGGYYGWPGMQPLPSNGMGTAALVLGIVAAALFCMWPLSIISGILGVIFGVMGRAKAKRGEATNGGQALAGIICGAAGLVLSIGMLILLIAARV